MPPQPPLEIAGPHPKLPCPPVWVVKDYKTGIIGSRLGHGDEAAAQTLLRKAV